MTNITACFSIGRYSILSVLLAVDILRPVTSIYPGVEEESWGARHQDRSQPHTFIVETAVVGMGNEDSVAVLTLMADCIEVFFIQRFSKSCYYEHRKDCWCWIWKHFLSFLCIDLLLLKDVFPHWHNFELLRLLYLVSVCSVISCTSQCIVLLELRCFTTNRNSLKLLVARRQAGNFWTFVTIILK